MFFCYFYWFVGWSGEDDGVGDGVGDGDGVGVGVGDGDGEGEGDGVEWDSFRVYVAASLWTPLYPL